MRAGADEKLKQATPFALPVDTDWCANYVSQFWRTCETAPAFAAKLAKAVSIYKIYNGRNVDGDGHQAFPRLYKDPLLRKLSGVWASMVKKNLFPPKSPWLEITGADGERTDEHEAVAMLMRRKLGRIGFEGQIRNIIRDAALFYGVVTVTGYGPRWDGTEGKVVEGPFLTAYNLHDFVLDTSAPARTGVTPNLAYRFTLTREELREMASGDNPVYDREAVEAVIDANEREGVSDNALKLAIDGEKDGNKTGDEKPFTIIEFRGRPQHPSEDMPHDTVITVCGDTCLRAHANRLPITEVTVWHCGAGPEQGYMGENIGEILAEHNRNLNFLGSLLLFIAQVKATPTLTLDVADDDASITTFLKYAELVKVGINSVVPNPGGLRTLDINADPSELRMMMEREQKEARELIGVSDAALAALPSPSTSATAFNLTSQAGQTRSFDDAEHFNQFVEEVVQKMLVLLQHSMVEPERVVLPGGTQDDPREVMVTREMLAGITLTADIRNMAVSSTTGYQQQAAMQFLQIFNGNIPPEKRDPVKVVQFAETMLPVPVGITKQLMVEEAPPVPVPEAPPQPVGPPPVPVDVQQIMAAMPGPEPVPTGVGGLLSGQEVPT